MADFSDNFNRADAPTLGANWLNQVDGQQIISNTARILNTDNSYQFSLYSSGTFTNNQYSRITIGVMNGQLGPIVRASGTGGSTNNYWLLCRPFTDGSSFLFKTVAGSFGLLLDLGLVVWLNSDVAEITAVGTTITAYQNGTPLGNASDSDLSSGKAGQFFRAVDTDGSISLWEGGDIGGGGSTYPGYQSPFGWHRNKKFHNPLEEKYLRDHRHIPILKAA